jgi:hypothetical protein
LAYPPSAKKITTVGNVVIKLFETSLLMLRKKVALSAKSNMCYFGSWSAQIMPYHCSPLFKWLKVFSALIGYSVIVFGKAHPALSMKLVCEKGYSLHYDGPTFCQNKLEMHARTKHPGCYSKLKITPKSCFALYWDCTINILLTVKITLSK